MRYRIHIYGHDGNTDYWITHETPAKNSAQACDSALNSIRRNDGWPEWVKPHVWKIEQVEDVDRLLAGSAVQDEVDEQEHKQHSQDDR